MFYLKAYKFEIRLNGNVLYVIEIKLPKYDNAPDLFSANDAF